MRSSFRHRWRMVCLCVCVCVFADKASSCRARQVMLGFFSPDSRVQVTQSTKQVVVQSCGLTSNRKAARNPPAREQQNL